MNVALAPQNHLGRIPEELLLEIIKQPCLSDCDLISLARTNRRHYRVAISPAYKAHVKRSHGMAIYWAIENERQATLERLSENGVDFDMDFASDGEYLDTDELQEAMDRLKFTKAHMPEAVNFEVESEVWATPLAWAAFHGQDSIVEYLLDKGANLELGSHGLCYCCHKVLHCCPSDDLPVPPHLCLIDKHDDVINADGWNPLHYAICNGHVSTAKLLLARGADTHNVGGMGYVGRRVPALLVATYLGLNEIVDFLVEQCAIDVNVKTHNGITALHVAHVAGNYGLVFKYLEQGADINVSFSGINGPWTIFAMACVEGEFGLAMKYLENGADPRFVIQNQHGHEHSSDKYTALRLIWHYGMDDREIRAGRLDSAMKLEQKIIARSNADPPVNEEKE